MFKHFPSLSDFETRKEWEGVVWIAMIEQLSRMSQTELQKVLSSILSKQEKKQLLLRAVALTLLSEGASYREIGRQLWVTPQTISAVKKGFARSAYESNWQRASEQALARQLAKSRAKERPLPAYYRNTKYGRLRIR